ncbi:MAG: hypothetical protein QW039_05340 [Fervidicoccaceae archaeon]
MDIIASALAILGSAVIIFSLITEKWSLSIVSILFGSLLIGLSIAAEVDPKAGLAVVLIYSGGLTALTYVSTILLSKKEAVIASSGKLLKLIVIPALVSVLFSTAIKIAGPRGGSCILSPTLPISYLDITSLATALVIAIGIIIILLGGARK